MVDGDDVLCKGDIEELGALDKALTGVTFLARVRPGQEQSGRNLLDENPGMEFSLVQSLK